MVETRYVRQSMSNKDTLQSLEVLPFQLALKRKHTTDTKTYLLFQGELDRPGDHRMGY
jgi:hypothetical protein